MTSLNDDHPGDIAHSSKSSTNPSALVRSRVPDPSHRLGGPPLPPLVLPPLPVLPLLVPLPPVPLPLPLVLVLMPPLLVLPLVPLPPPLEPPPLPVLPPRVPPLVLPLPPPLLLPDPGELVEPEHANPAHAPATIKRTGAMLVDTRDVIWRIFIHPSLVRRHP
jgi:hypothetical protein